MTRKLLSELIASFITGGLPLLIVYRQSGYEEFKLWLERIDLSSPVVMYLFSLFLIQQAISRLGVFKRGYLEGVRSRFVLYYTIANKVGDGLTSFTRVVAGASIATSFIATFGQVDVTPKIVIVLWLVSSFFIVGACIFSAANESAVTIQR